MLKLKLGFSSISGMNEFLGFTIVVFILFQSVTIDEGDSDKSFSVIKLVVYHCLGFVFL